MEKLIFVYNADSGKLNALMGSLHKMVNPSTYACKLCELTYGKVEEKRSWKRFRENLELETEFLHRDEFQKMYASKFGHKFEFPIILGQTAKGLEVVISYKKLLEINSTEELIHTLEQNI